MNETESLKAAHPGCWLQPGPIHLAKPDEQGRVRRQQMTMCRDWWTIPPNRTLVRQFITCAVCRRIADAHPEWFVEAPRGPDDSLVAFLGPRFVLKPR